MWFGVSDDTLTPLAVPPVQFYDVWSRSRAVSPERGLALAVMEQAINDLITHRFARRRRHQRAYWDAYQWMVADDYKWPFSFISLCASRSAWRRSPSAGGCSMGQTRETCLDQSRSATHGR
jgi:hypothetical protein